MKIAIVAGTRPNFMKIAPLFRELQRHPDEFSSFIVHTGQHYDSNMSDVFFNDLSMPTPHHFLQVRTDGTVAQLADIIGKFDIVLQRECPELVVVVGDVISTLAAAMAAAACDIPLAHIEAGLRCGDRRLPEEVYRVATDAVADLLFTYSADADDNLIAENVPTRCIHRVGNLMIDSLRALQPKAQSSSVLSEIGLQECSYGVVTLHRQSNVNDPSVLKGILSALIEIQKRITLVFPMHPRTRKNIDAFGLKPMIDCAPNLRIADPLGYLDMVQLLGSAAMALVDSGGIQEETTVLGTPCLTVRDHTERPITVTQGTNRLIGTAPDRIVAEAGRILDGDVPEGTIPELWDGHSAERVVEKLRGSVERR